jgi:hypothetical protein
MAEQFQFSQDVLNLAWDDAEAANRAFDDLRKTEHTFDVLHEANQLQGVTVQGETLDNATQDISNARGNFNFLNDKVALVVTSKKHNPFHSLEEADSADKSTERVIVVPEITEETHEKLSALPEEYVSVVHAQYEETADLFASIPARVRAYKIELANIDPAVESARSGQLQAQITRLEAVHDIMGVPDLNELVNEVVELAPIFEAYDAKDWQPNIGFVPYGLATELWDALLTGHDLPDGSTSNGAYSTYDGNVVFNPHPPVAGIDPGWGVVAYSDTDGPVIRNVSKDGEHGSNAKKAVKELSSLPGLTEPLTPESVIAQVSPNRAAYNTMQLNRLMSSRALLDSQTWTIGRENVEVDGGLKSVFLRSDPWARRVGSGWRVRGGADDYDGVRPSAERKKS